MGRSPRHGGGFRVETDRQSGGPRPAICPRDGPRARDAALTAIRRSRTLSALTKNRSADCRLLPLRHGRSPHNALNSPGCPSPKRRRAHLVEIHRKRRHAPGGLRLSALPRVDGSRSPVEGNRKGERYWSVARGSGGRPRTMLRDGRIDDGGHRPREAARRCPPRALRRASRLARPCRARDESVHGDSTRNTR